MKKSRLLLVLVLLSLISMQTQSSSLYSIKTDYQMGKTPSNPDISSKIWQIPDILRMGDLNIYGLLMDFDPLTRAWVVPHSIMYEPLIEYDAKRNLVCLNYK